MTDKDTLTDRNRPSRVVVVVGMHRSGTSAVARGLKALGVELGDNLSGAAEDNPKAFWEDADIKALNDRLLGILGYSWQSVTPIDGRIWETTSLDALIQAALELLRARFGGSALWGFKDPRTARLLPFWKQVFDRLGVSPSFIITIRNPLAVMRSLRLRNEFTPERAYLLWLEHMLPAVSETQGFSRVVSDYDRLMEAPERELRRVADRLDIAIGAAEAAAISEYAGRFIDKGLRHSVYSEQDLATVAGPAALAGRAYSLLLNAAGDKSSLDNQAVSSEWAELHAQLEVYYPLLGYLDAYEDAIRLTAQEKVDFLEQGIRERDGEIGRLGRVLQERDSEINRLVGVVAGASEELKQINEKSRQADARLERTAEELRQAGAKLEHADEALRQAHGRNQALQEQLQWSIDLLNKERYSVVKPVARKVYRRLRRLLNHLPPVLQMKIRQAGRRIMGRGMMLEIPLPVAPPPPGAHAGHDSALVKQALTARGGGYDCFVFPVIDWHFRIQRPQHLAREMAARGHRVFYLTTTFMDADAGPGFNILESPEPDLFICQLACLRPHPVIYEDAPGGDVRASLLQSIEMLARACDIGPVVSILDLPFWRSIAEAIPGNLVVYDCMDLHAGFSTNDPAMLGEEDLLLEQADLVVTTSSRLSEVVAEKRDNAIIRNAAEVTAFREPPEQLRLDTSRKVVGYYGAISEWFDVGLVCAAAARYPDWDFVLIGAASMIDVARLEKLDNVKLPGEVPYGELPGYLHAFDVAIIPFKLTELTLCTNPVKVYEYLAAGKPVVASALPELALISDQVHIAVNAEDFVLKLQAAMDESGDSDLRAARAQWAARHTWLSRVEELESMIHRLYPRVSVIVLTYNNLAYTRDCLSSIEAYSQYPNLELILVDNASSDGTRDFLQEYSAQHPDVRIILNEENLGFAAGNNLGLAQATGDYLVMLNNDTFVTRGWVTDLVRHLRRDHGLGLVGPVTNNIGNEAKIDIAYDDMEQMAHAACQYTSQRPRRHLAVRNVAFFCVAMGRTVYERVGALDESYGIGFFEDDDYCNRVRALGFRIAIAEDVFVHHHLSASFELLEDEERTRLFQTNKAHYESKWGKWIPHSYRH